MKFVGHLDMMRYFQKAIRRANVDIAYSEGYSPHQIMSFASPLGVGITSECEYLDIELNSYEEPDKLLEALNNVMVDEVEILEFRYLEDKSKNAMSIVSAADYLITFRKGFELKVVDLESSINTFYEQSHITTLKKTKKSEKEVDIKSMIYEIYTLNDGIFMKLSAGSVSNLKPELVMNAFYQYLGLEMPKFAVEIKRLEVYLDEE